eukprot:gnl/TRDRNA2_/TRDRNA2_41481_c0_seq1.p1 gnl/TRDRNA2_/TRDRNA2_41481_c0~~gnl/TRDRNA2_/TRDRNA2_41481_c0_seq1.p1  ORF type:complete len:336 (+),score=32.96 gnl/TRDRNA2_/TRDRNA2_41481_c0_seq1:139-1146(+)
MGRHVAGIFIVYGMAAAVLVGLSVFHLSQSAGWTPYSLFLLCSFSATAAAVCVSVRHIVAVLWSDTLMARERILVVRLVGMVPLTALNALFGLLEHFGHIETRLLDDALDACKEIYEAVVLHSFLQLLLLYLRVGEDGAKAVAVEENKVPTAARPSPVLPGLSVRPLIPVSILGRVVRHSFPFNLFMRPLLLTTRSVHILTMLTQQFVMLRPIIAALDLSMDVLGLESWIVSTSCTVVLNISVSMALYALVLLHHGFHEELKNCAIMAKLAMVKGIVALGCYQAVLLSVLVHFRVVHSDHWFTSEEIASGMQDSLICFEMGVAFCWLAVYAFPTK